MIVCDLETEMSIMEPNLQILATNGQTEKNAIVSVIISLFNYESYIEECLESVKAQTLRHLEIIVVDDCSADGSLELVLKWFHVNGPRFSSYVVGRQKINRGLALTRNAALALTKTAYVLPLDADNVLYPRCLQQLQSALDHCDASFAYCYLEKFGNVNCLQNTMPWNPGGFRYGNTIDAMVLHRKGVLDQLGGYSVDMPVMGWEDFDLWFNIAKNNGWGLMVPEILARYRVHKESMLLSITNPNYEKLWNYLQDKYPDQLTPLTT